MLDDSESPERQKGEIKGEGGDMTATVRRREMLKNVKGFPLISEAKAF